MGIYRVPPSPHIGGWQPLAPRKLPPSNLAVAVNDPPLGQRTWLTAILRAWRPLPPQPQVAWKLSAGLLNVPADRPPFGQRLWLSGVRGMWQPDPPLPQRPLRGVPPPSVTPVGAFRDKVTLGTKESIGITSDPTLGGWWGQ